MPQKVEATEANKPIPTKQTLTEEQRANLGKRILGTDTPESASAGDIAEALAEVSKSEVTVPEEKEETKEETKTETPPKVEGVPQMTLDEYNAMQESVQAMRALDQHPDMVQAIVQELKARQGNASPSIESDTETETETGEVKTMRTEMQELKNIMGTMAQRLAILGQQATVENWKDLAPVVEAIRQKNPELSIEAATEFARDKLVAQGKLEVGKVTAPLQTSESATSAGPKSDSDKSRTELLNEAAAKVMKPKTTAEAIEIAFKEAIKMEQLKEQQGV